MTDESAKSDLYHIRFIFVSKDSMEMIIKHSDYPELEATLHGVINENAQPDTPAKIVKIEHAHGTINFLADTLVGWVARNLNIKHPLIQ